MGKLSHVDSKNRPSMVNVGGKSVTRRVAGAQATIRAPASVLKLFKGGELHSKKGPVFQTAIIAGVMAAKRASEWIPLCHPIGLDDCQISIFLRARKIVIECRCEVSHKTGVEMEALTGATVAALTVYDMCKAISHDIVIENVRLMEKTGGRSNFKR